MAQSPDVLPGLHNLYERGQRNGVQLELVSEARAAELEPIARTYKEALWSPTTAAAGPSVFLLGDRQPSQPLLSMLIGVRDHV